MYWEGAGRRGGAVHLRPDEGADGQVRQRAAGPWSGEGRQGVPVQWGGRVPELYVAFFGILKVGAIAGPLFSAFGPDPVKDRLLDSGAKALIVTPELRSRISGILGDLPDLKQHRNRQQEQPLPGTPGCGGHQLRGGDGLGVVRLRHRAHHGGGLLHHALHLRHNGQTQGRRPRPPGGIAAHGNRPVGPGPPR